jgi:hypothetical protein
MSSPYLSSAARPQTINGRDGDGCLRFNGYNNGDDVAQRGRRKIGLVGFCFIRDIDRCGYGIMLPCWKLQSTLGIQHRTAVSWEPGAVMQPV